MDGAMKTEATEDKQQTLPKAEMQWFKMLFHLHLILCAIYSIFITLTEAYFATTILAIILGFFSLLGVTAGAHRLWAHQSYSASWTVQLFLMICQTMSGTGSIYDWVLNHRIHHKYHGTNNDPHNYKRGFMYSHFLSHLYSNSSNYEELKRSIDMSDLESNKIVMFQKRFYWVLMPVLAFYIPINLPLEYWGESVFNSACVLGILRYTVVLHCTWMIYSSMLIWGLQSESNYSADTNWIFLINMSFWPYYHYLLPWDYQTGEYGTYGSGCTTAFIRICATLRWATDLKTIDSKAVRCALENHIKNDIPFEESLFNEGKKFSESLNHDKFLCNQDHF